MGLVEKARGGMTVNLTHKEAALVIDALSIAVEELDYRVAELADTGDYTAEDIAGMNRKAEAFDKLLGYLVSAGERG